MNRVGRRAPELELSEEEDEELAEDDTRLTSLSRREAAFGAWLLFDGLSLICTRLSRSS